MCREDERTQHHQQVAAADGQRFIDAEEVKSHRRQRHREPDRRRDPFAEKQPHNRHQHDIKRRNKARLPGAGFRQARLLQAGRRSQCGTAAQPAQHQIPGACRQRPDRLRIFLSLEGAYDPIAQRQRDERHRAAQGIKGDGRDVAGADALRHKGGAPDEGGHHRQYILSDFRVHCVSFSSLPAGLIPLPRNGIDSHRFRQEPFLFFLF